MRALSWSVVHFLMDSPGGQAAMQRLLVMLRERKEVYSFEALDRTYEGGAAALERQWIEHVQAQGKGPP